MLQINQLAGLTRASTVNNASDRSPPTRKMPQKFDIPRRLKVAAALVAIVVSLGQVAISYYSFKIQGHLSRIESETRTATLELERLQTEREFGQVLLSRWDTMMETWTGIENTWETEPDEETSHLCTHVWLQAEAIEAMLKTEGADALGVFCGCRMVDNHPDGFPDFADARCAEYYAAWRGITTPDGLHLVEAVRAETQKHIANIARDIGEQFTTLANDVPADGARSE